MFKKTLLIIKTWGETFKQEIIKLHNLEAIGYLFILFLFDYCKKTVYT